MVGGGEKRILVLKIDFHQRQRMGKGLQYLEEKGELRLKSRVINLWWECEMKKGEKFTEQKSKMLFF